MATQINKQTNKQTKHTHWQIIKIDIQQYGKIGRKSSSRGETSVFLMAVILTCFD